MVRKFCKASPAYPLALAFRPLVVAAEVGAEVVPLDEVGALEEEEAELLLDAELEDDDETDEEAEEALPFKQESSLLDWMGTWLE